MTTPSQQLWDAVLERHARDLILALGRGPTVIIVEPDSVHGAAIAQWHHETQPVFAVSAENTERLAWAHRNTHPDLAAFLGKRERGAVKIVAFLKDRALWKTRHRKSLAHVSTVGSA